MGTSVLTYIRLEGEAVLLIVFHSTLIMWRMCGGNPVIPEHPQNVHTTNARMMWMTQM